VTGGVNHYACTRAPALAHRFGIEQAVTQLGLSADIMGVDKHLLPTGYAEQAHESWLRNDLGHPVHNNPLKGPPLSFPAHLHELYYSTPAVTWFDAVAVSGWNDQRRITDGSTQLAVLRRGFACLRGGTKLATFSESRAP
jgi:hypothetical protein